MKNFTRISSYLTLVASLCWSVASAQFTCDTPIPISCGETVFGTTTGVPNDNASSGAPTCITPVGTGGQYWYSFTAPANGTCTLDTEGSDYDTKIHVYTGTCGSLYCVTGDDDSGTGLNSLASFEFMGGTTYLIRAGGFGANQGNFQLNIFCTLDFNGCTDPSACNFSSYAITDDASCCYSNCRRINVGGGNFPAEVSWQLFDASGFEIASGGAPDTEIICVNEGCGYQLVMYDTFGDGWNGNVFSITDENGNIETAISMQNGTGPETVQLSIGGFIGGCTDPAANNYDPIAQCDNGSCVTCTGNSSLYTMTMFDTGNTGWNGATWRIIDEASSSIIETGSLYSGNSGSYSQCLSPGCYTMETTAGSFPNQISWELTDANGTLVAEGGANMTIGFPWDGAFCYIPGCTDSGCNNYNFNATTDDGSCVCPPSNDDCSNATPIGCGVTVSGTTVNANFDPSAISCDANTQITSPGVWYTFIGTGDLVNLSTCGSAAGDTRIHVFSGNCETPVCVTQNDDGCASGFLSSVSFTAINGFAYYVLVSEFGTFGTGVNFELTMTCVQCNNTAVNDECANALPLPTGVEFPGSLCCANPDDEMGEWAGFGTEYGIWYVINSQDFTNLSISFFNGAGEGPDAADGTDVGIGLFEGTAGCGALTPLLGGVGFNGNPTDGFAFNSLEFGLDITANTNYYICVSTSDPINCGDFVLTVDWVNAGCLDQTACNYCIDCTLDNQTCVYPGCTDPTATNYSPNAGCEDGSCIYNGISGCTDVTACNYNADATIDDFSCVYPGCTDPTATNYNPNAGCDDGSCVQSQFICDCAGTQHTSGVLTWIGDGFEDAGAYTWEGQPVDFNCATWGYDCGDIIGAPSNDPYGVCAGDLPPNNGCDISIVFGCTDPIATNYNPNATTDDGSCIYNETPGCTDITACNYNADATIDDLSCVYPGCIDQSACNFNQGAACDDGSCVFGGCTFPDACNYDAQAGCDDGSCLFAGCTDPNAYNYDFNAGCDDGSCLYDIFGCTDPTASNYDAAANIDDGSCIFASCENLELAAVQTSCQPSADGALYPGVDFTMNFDGDCFAQLLVITLEGTDYPLEILAPDNIDGSVFSITGFPENSTFNAYFSLSDGSTSPVYEFSVTSCAQDPLICDCAGTQHTSGVLIWIGDSFADDGSYAWQGQPVDFNCATWGYDCGDIIGAPANDPYGVCAGDLPPNNGCDISIVFGCTDPSATNYNPNATTDDGSCTYNETPGCTDITACNYNADATIDDLSCVYPGCIDQSACNFNQGAACDDGSCVYGGCTFPGACNYDAQAGCDDGSCSFAGCTASNACNYDVNAGCDDGSCVFPGCTDVTACNYDATAACDDGSCILPNGCSDATACNFSPNTICDDGSCTYPGCTDATAINFNINAGCDDGSCVYIGVGGCTDITACNYNPDATVNNFTCVYPGCTDPTSCNYSSNAACDDGSCIYPGCTDPTSCNYESNAGCDDGSCVYPGCTDVASCNYNPSAGCDDGSCTFEGCTAVDACNYDADAGCDDGSCTFPGCNDATACNYDATAGCNDGSCQYSGCTNPNACNFNPTAACDNGTCILPNGCSDATACNFSPNTICDDGSCTYPGCTDATAINYNINAGCDDGSCVYTGVGGCTDITACNYNPDATVNNFTCVYPGCTDPTSCNYSSNAACDDGSCIYPGCTDPTSCNYESNAGCDDGSCVYPGCTDVASCNYNPSAGCDDGSCTFEGCTAADACNYDADAGCDDGSCTFPGCNDQDACNYNPQAGCYDGTCTYSGCTDADAVNYNINAGCDDGSCVYTGVGGCTDITACNYNPDATVNNFTCVYPGCTDPTSCNYSSNAGCDDGSCIYPGCTDMSSCDYNPSAGCDDGSCTFAGCTSMDACNYDATAGCDDGSCTFAGCTDPTALNYDSTAGCDDGSCAFNSINGCTDVTACNYDANATVDDLSCVYPGCTDMSSCNYNASAGCDDGTCTFAGCTSMDACNYDAAAGCDDGSCTFAGCTDPTAFNYDSTAGCDDGSCAYDGIAGCTDVTACNYDANATIDDLSCVYPGCTDMSSCNYNASAGCDDGSCTFAGCTSMDACNYDAAAGCDDGSCTFAGCTDPTALNYDSTAGCDDGSCEYAGIEGCTDATACNYNADATIDDLSCVYPGCTDPTACNYDLTAGCDNGSCTYLEGEISGPTSAVPGTETNYSFPCDAGCVYEWVVLDNFGNQSTEALVVGTNNTCEVTIAWLNNFSGGTVQLNVSCANGCSGVYTYSVSPNSIAFTLSNPISVYPNPTLHLSTLEVPESMLGGTMTIYNNVGSLISSGQLTNRRMAIDASQWSAGVYTIVLSDGIREAKRVQLIKE